MALARRRIVVKLGTQVVMEEGGQLARLRLTQLVHEIAQAHEAGHELVVISSGAVGLGRTELGSRQLGKSDQNRNPLAILAEKQACASVGQSLLMETYRRIFSEFALDRNQTPIKVGQLLVTAQDFSDRVHYLNLKRTLEMTLKLGAIPIINENDPVSVAEIKDSERSHSFGDNDALSALVASKLGADLLILLTNVDAVYSENPKVNPQAKPIRSIQDWSVLDKLELSGASTEGRGGMLSKLQAARLASQGGVRVVIGSGLASGSVTRAIAESETSPTFGTWIAPSSRKLGRRDLWIGGASGYAGTCRINAGAERALIDRNASLLVAGVLDVGGTFQKGNVIQVRAEDGRELGRGLARWDSRELSKMAGKSKLQLEAEGIVRRSVVIHHDDFVLSEGFLLKSGGG